MPTCPRCKKRYPDGVNACGDDGAMLMPDTAYASLETELPAGSRVGEYIIDETIGEGGFGTVYRGTHPVIGKSAAVKVLKREFSSNPEMVSRFIAEARAVNQIRHRNIIDIFAFGTLDDGRHFYVMELLEGTTLDHLIEKNGRVELHDALPILKQLGRALGAVHAAGITHRDLKPENVFLTYDDDGTAIPKLLDFGIAKLMADGQPHHKTRSGTPMGTPLYMSPEQVHGRAVDHRTDIYAFGILVHETLTGTPPFDGESVMDVLTKQTTAAPPPMSSMASLPVELDAPVLAMLEKDPANRPQSVSHAVDQLLAAAESAGILVARSLSRSGPGGGGAGVASGRVSYDSPTPNHNANDGRLGDPLSRPTPRSQSSSGGGRQGTPPAALATTLDPGQRRSSGAPAMRSANRRKLIAAGAFGCAAFALVIAVGSAKNWFGKGAAAAAATSAPSVPASQAAITEAPPPPDPTHVQPTDNDHIRVSIEGNTDSIDVFLGSDRLGGSEAPIQLPKSSTRVKLTLKKQGFTPRDIWITPTHDLTLSTDLSRIPGSPQPRPAGKGSPSPSATPRASSELEF